METPEELRTPPNTRGPGSRAAEYVLWGLLIIITISSRFAVAPRVLYDWDAANYALALRHFDVYEHQAHPPGYPIYVLLLKMASWFTSGATTPFLILNAIFTLLTLILLGLLMRRRAGPWLTLAFVGSFAASPLFWHQGAASTIYVAEAFGSVITAYLAFKLIARELGISVVAAIFGLVLGLRPGAAITLTPLILVAAYYARAPRRRLLVAVGVFSSVVALWFLPTVLLTGVHRYIAASAALGQWQLDLGSVLTGNFSRFFPRLGNLLRYLWDSSSVLLLFLGAYLLIARSSDPWRKSRSAILFAAWVLPGILVYAGHHLPKSGYVLTLEPAVYVAAAWVVVAIVASRTTLRWRRGLMTGVFVVLGLFTMLNVYGFFRAVPRELLQRRDAQISLPDPVLLSGDYGVHALEYRTYPQRQMLRILRRFKEDDAALFLMGAHELHRLATFYTPKLWLIATSVDHQHLLCTHPLCLQRQSFGDFQLEVLHAPKQRTWGKVSTLELAEGKLSLGRGGASMTIPLVRLPKRLVIFYACPPCRLNLGRGLRHLAFLRVGGGYRARVVSFVDGENLSSMGKKGSGDLGTLTNAQK